MKNKYIIIIAVTYLTMCHSNLSYAIEPPAPLEVANTVSNLWVVSDLTRLASYITNLYASCPNYIPAILAESFYNGIYQGRLAEASNKLHRVQVMVESSPGEFTDYFKDMLSDCVRELSEEIEGHVEMGRTPAELEANAAPEAVRAATSLLTVDLLILFYAPATNAPSISDSDSDGLQDWWELQHFGDLNEASVGDPDYDGFTNLQEYQNGTDPNNPINTHTIYINSNIGNDSWEGYAPVWDGTHGPKKKISAGIEAAISGDTIKAEGGSYADEPISYDLGNKSLVIIPSGSVVND